MEMENWPKDFEAATALNTEERGFTRIINAVIRSGALSFGEKVIFSTLLSHSFDFRQCYTKHATLAKECGCGTSTIKRYLYSLRDKGVIRWRKAGFGRCNQYFINPTISELIEESIRTDTPSNSTNRESSIRPHTASQLDYRRTNEKKTTSENKSFKITSTSSYKKTGVFEDYDRPLKDRGLESQAVYLAQRLKEEHSIPKYRHVVKRYKPPTIQKVLGATVDLESDGRLEKGPAAYFWGALKSVAGEGDK